MKTRIAVVVAIALASLTQGFAQANDPAPPVLAGKWHVRFTQLSRVHLRKPPSTSRTWIFRRVCGHGHCVRRLLFGLTNGGYETFTIHRVASQNWIGTRHGRGAYCFKRGRYVGRGFERISIHVTASDDSRATALEAYYRARYVGGCDDGGTRVATEVRRFRGQPAAG